MKYYGQFELDGYLHDKYFSNNKKGFFVECGAYDGIEESTCLFFEKELNWKGINIEAVPEIFEYLEKNRPNCINISGALYNENCIKKFTHIIHPERGFYFGNGSLQHKDSHLKELLDYGCKEHSFEVNCFPFSTWFNNFYKRKPKIDLFVLDVEGGELEAIEGILTLNKNHYPKIFVIEHSLVGISNITELIDEHYYFDTVYYQNSIFVRKY